MEQLWQSVKIAVRALRINKMRSFLTMLGIIIGIASVIAMVAIGAGAESIISQQISSMGSNLILVIPGSAKTGGVQMGPGAVPTLVSDDGRAIKSECPSVEAAAPNIRVGSQIVYANQNWATQITGVTPDFLVVRDWKLASGRPLTQSDVDGATKNCIIGKTIVKELFGSVDPLDKVIRVRKVPFRVIGVLKKKGQSPQGTDQDDVVLIPLSTAQRKVFGSPFPNAVGAIIVKARHKGVINRAEAEITALLRQRHHISAKKDDDFTVKNLSELLAVATTSSRTMSLLLGSVASISLIVGGIGIMNIMLVSVTERTREIGIRMAVGAREKDILLQFLTEAVFLTLLGGIVGIGVGVAGATVVSKVFTWPTLVSANAIVVAVVFSGAVGIFFGFYPARKAASLNPIDALRYE
ncbi:MAG: ABC transporter permease [Desulfuromonadales bacterium]|nr:ABC transporter permease [Desulfuromonadales bacterium]